MRKLKSLVLLGLFFTIGVQAQGIIPRPGGASSYKTAVATVAALPATGNTPADMRITMDTFSIYVWNGASWILSGGGGAGAVTSVFGRNGVVIASSGDYNTSQVTENTNLYYTQARFDTAFGAKSTSDLAEGSNLYFTNARARTATVTSSISSGDTTHSPDGNSVFNALAGKEPSIVATTSADYYRGDKTFQTLNTLAVPELTNLYYTQARFDTAFSGKSTSNLSEGSNLYYTQARFDSALGLKSTSNLAEGSNLYFTNARAIAAPITGFTSGAGVVAGTDSVLQAIQKLDGNIGANTTAIAGKQTGPLSGDGTTPSTASGVFTLATVNGSPGSFGDATHSLSATVNGKGLITSLSTNVIQIPESQVTNLTADLALKAPLASPALTGVPTAPTAAGATNTTQVATTAFVEGEIAAIPAAPVSSVFTRTGAVTAQSGDYNTSQVTENTNLYYTNARAIAAPITGFLSGAGALSATDTILQAINKLDGNIAAVSSGITSLTGDGTATGPGAAAFTLATVASAGTSTKVTYNAKGLVTSGTTLASSDIPSLDFSKITTGTVPVSQGGTNKTSYTAGNVVYAGASGTSLTEDSTSSFVYDATNKRLSINGTGGTGKLNGTVTSGTDSAITGFCTGTTGNCLSVQNQASYTAQFINAANSAVTGATIGGAFSRGTLAARTQSLAGDQLFSLSSQGYTGSAFSAGLTNAISFVATENTTATAAGGSLVFSTTPNTTLVPVSRMSIGQNGAVNISNLTASQFVKTDASKNLVSSLLASGDIPNNAANTTGSAATLTTPRAINGVNFDGSAAITVTAAAGTLTGTTLNSTVVTSSLTSVGTLANLTVTNPITGSVTGNAATVTTNANLTGPITSVGNATSVASQTGTGTKFVMDSSPTLTGTPLTPTAAPGTNTTQIASTAFVTAAVAAAGGTPAASTITGNTTLASTTKFYAANTTGGTFTVTLPAAASNSGVSFVVKDITFGGASVSVARTGSDTIEGATSDTITAGEGKTYFSDGTNWYLAN